MSDITLSAGVRSNLLSLQGTASLLDRTQERLSTGKKVNGPLDDAAAFFTARGLSGRANDLSSIMQGMQNGMKTIDAASKGLSSITTTMENLVGTVRQALGDPGGVSRESTAFTIGNDDYANNDITVDGETFSLGALNFQTDGLGSNAERANAFVNTINTNADARAAGVSAKINPDNADEVILVNE